jgi:hypothetical protein
VPPAHPPRHLHRPYLGPAVAAHGDHVLDP